MDLYPRKRTSRSVIARIIGFTLIEMLIAIAIIGIVISIAIPAYQEYVKEGEIYVAVQDLRNISLLIEDVEISGSMPASLAEIGVNYNDPWGNPYQYLNLLDPANKGKGKARKDKNLVPINSDYDLYSMGPDGKSVGPLTAKASHDDIVRANDGGFYGIATDY
jgi:general secretion pathway protein G